MNIRQTSWVFCNELQSGPCVLFKEQRFPPHTHPIKVNLCFLSYYTGLPFSQQQDPGVNSVMVL